MDTTTSSVAPPKTAMSLEWSFGFQGRVHSLTTMSRTAVFYATAHTGVIYDYAAKTQQLLQGHCNPITSTAVSSDKKWLVTADSGPDSVIVVWDAASGTPVKTIFNPHPRGVAAVAISDDAMFLASLSATHPSDADEQELSLWEWTVDNEGALYSTPVPSVTGSGSAHTSVAFNPADPREIVTNGPKSICYWTWENYQLAPYSPILSKGDIAMLASTTLLMSIFIPDTTMAATSTASGSIIIWDAVSKDDEVPDVSNNAAEADNQFIETNPMKAVVKSIHLCEGSIDTICTVDSKYLVVAGEDGAVRFYDFAIRIIAWFEDLNAGPITSVSFSSTSPNDMLGAELGDDFVCPDFVVGTSTSYVIGVESALFQEIEPENRRGVVLVQGIGDEVPCIAAHPSMDRLVIGVYDGTLQLWDFRNRALLMVQELVSEVAHAAPVKQRPQTLSFDAAGKFLAIGMTSGALKISDPDSLSEIESFVNGESPIINTKFSANSAWLACADAQHYVSIYNYTMVEISPAQQPEDGEDDGASMNSGSQGALSALKWVYVGRYKSHSKAITGLEFTTREDGRVALISVAEDRTLVEYDLQNTSFENGVKLRSEPTVIEQTAIPTACMWHPLLGGDFEDRIVTANNDFKFKQWNADNKHCRRTSLCPTYGGPLNSLTSVPALDPTTNQYGPSPYVVYSTAEKVVGIIKIPFDGNPHKAMGLIAHPTAISSVAVSGNGRYVMTAGGSDRCVNIWQADVSVIAAKEAAAAEECKAAGKGSASMYDELIDPEVYEDLVDFFYYAQLRTQGEDTTEEREITGLVPLTEIPNMVRALGFYPSEEEVVSMIAEVKYAVFTETGETKEFLDLDTFVKLFINHKPVFGVSKSDIVDAFGALGGELPWGQLTKMLKEKGEAISEDELKNIVGALLGAGGEVNPVEHMDASDFADKILGFDENVEEPELEGAITGVEELEL